jgi:hypothetical protein
MLPYALQQGCEGWAGRFICLGEQTRGSDCFGYTGAKWHDWPLSHGFSTQPFLGIQMVLAIGSLSDLCKHSSGDRSCSLVRRQRAALFLMISLFAPSMYQALLPCYGHSAPYSGPFRKAHKSACSLESPV